MGLKYMLVSSLVLLLLSSSCFAQSWKKLILLKSTRADVEKIFKTRGSILDPSSTIYEVKVAQIVVRYSFGSCENDEDSIWNVPSGILIAYSVFPKTSLFVDELKYNLATFERRQIGKDTPGMYTYINDAEGISIVVDSNTKSGKEAVSRIGFFPNSAASNLKCRNSK